MAHPAARSAVTPQARRGLQVLGGVAVGQMSLGVVTLLNYVPLGLAAAHQLGSLAVLTSGVYVAHSLRYASPALLRGAVRKAAASASSGGVGKVAPAMGIALHRGSASVILNTVESTARRHCAQLLAPPTGCARPQANASAYQAGVAPTVPFLCAKVAARATGASAARSTARTSGSASSRDDSPRRAVRASPRAVNASS